MEHLFTWAGNQTQVSSMVGQFCHCTRNVPITSPRQCISKQVFFQTLHSLNKWPERTCNKPATSGNHLPPASAGCVMFLSSSLKVGAGSAVFSILCWLLVRNVYVECDVSCFRKQHINKCIEVLHTS